VWRTRLPAAYWSSLAKLRTEESRRLQTAAGSREAERLHLELAEMESAAGLGSSRKYAENFPAESSLTLFQQGLRDSELFLSFHTGRSASYLWTISRNSAHLYRLSGVSQMEQAVGQFRQAIAGHQLSAARLGAEIQDALFGQLDEAERGRKDWLLSVDGPLFELPFAALRGTHGYLIEQHSMQLVPSAGMLTSRAETGDGIVGVGDPIYNWADARLGVMREAPYAAEGQLNRLVASGDEVRRVGLAWPGEGWWLTGGDASRAAFLRSLTQHQPAAIHLATHVVSDKAGQGYLAFALGPNGAPELMGTADVAMLHVPGALVVMTGCSSGSGEVRPGAGQLGLEQAWLVAGARGVVATSWPVEDARGELVPAFYRNLALGISASEALRSGQVAMIRSNSWQADPAYWAAFQLTGGAR
jgi:CHAT domain-containing protein